MHWSLNNYTFINSIIIRRNEVVKCEWTPWQRTMIRLYYKQKGRWLQGSAFHPACQKIDRSSWGTVRRSIFFCYHRFSSGKTLPWPQRSNGSHPRSNSAMRGWTWEVRESPTESFDIPPFAFKAPGRALQKSFFPEPLLVLCKNRKTATRDRKHDHQFCNQRLIVILT